MKYGVKAEFEQLWRVRRPEVVRALSAAAAEGDRSENAEYQYRKKELREIDARLKYLTTRLQEVTVIDVRPRSDGKVYFGAWVEVVDQDDRTSRYRIVGADETDARAGLISVDSPVARALLGKTEGEVVRVVLPAGPAELEVMSVSYEAASPRA